MAADVLMGTDAHAEAWIRGLRGPRRAPARPGAGRRRGGRAARVGGAVRGVVSADDGALVVFTPSGRRGRFADGTRAPGRRARRSASTSTRSAAAAGSAVAARSCRWRARSRSTDHVLARPSDRRSPSRRSGTASGTGSRPTAGSGATRGSAGDLVVDVPPESQLHRQVVRKEADAHPIEVDPVVRLHYVEVREPDLADPSGDLAAAARGAPRREWALDDLARSTPIVLPGAAADAPRRRVDGDRRGPRRAHDLLRSGPGSTTWRSASRSTSARPRSPATSATCGRARCSRAPGAMNPQIRFGEDLMSRVSYVMMHPGGRARPDRRGARLPRRPGGRALRDGRRGARPTCSSSRSSGNPIMHHLVFGLDPTPLGVRAVRARHRRGARGSPLATSACR